MRTALPVRRALAAVTVTALAATTLSLIGGAASAADLARISETPAAGSLVGPPTTVSATYTQFLHPLSTIRVTNEQGPVCAANGPSPTADDAVRKTLSCTPAAGTAASGTYTVNVVAIDTTLPVPQELRESWTFTVDADAPTPSGVAISPDPLTSAADAINVAATFDEAGTATFLLSSDGGGSDSRTVQVVEDGPVQVSFDPASFEDGELTASVTLTDGFGNVSDTGTDSAPLDTTAPQRTAVAPQGTTTGGTAEDPTLVSATFDDDLAASSSLVVLTALGTEVSGGDAIGSSSDLPLMENRRKITFTPSEPLRDGVYTARVTAVDDRGNSETTTFTFTIDDEAPLAATATLEDPINAANVTSATVSGSASEPGLLITVTVDDGNPFTAETETTTSGADTSYSLDFDLTALRDGTVTATVVASDGPNDSPEATDTATKDTVAPAAPSVMLTPVEIGRANQDAVTVSGTVTDGSLPVDVLAFTPERGATVTVTIDDGSAATAPLVFVTTTDAEGGYAVSGIDVSGLADGTLTATVVATDGAGNDSAAGSGTADKDTTAPAAPTVVVPEYANADTAAALPVSGTGEPGSVIDIAIVDASGASATATVTIADDSDAYATDVNVSALADGLLGVSVTATDDRDNTGPAALTELVKDTAAPGAPTIVAPSYVNAANQGSYPVSGLAEPGATVTVTIDNDVDLDDLIIPPASAQGLADEDGFYSVVLDATAQRDGNLTLTASATDPAGNEGEDATASRTKDTKVPGAPADTAITPDPVRAGDAVTVSGAINELDRATPAGLTVHVVLSDTSDATVDPATSTASIGDAPESTWSVTFTAEQVALLADGTLTAHATVKDAAGNESPEGTDTATKNATPLTFVSSSPTHGSTVAPPATVELTFSEPLTGKDTNGNLKSTIQLRDTGGNLVNCPRDFSADSRTIFCSPTTTLSQAGSPYTATVTAYDSVSDTATATITFTVDATPPAAPTVDSATDPVNADSEPDVQVLLSGLASDVATATVTISDGSRSATATVTIDGETGSASVDTTSLAEGPLTVTATASDQYGNTSSASSPVEISKDSLQPQQSSASPSSGAILATPPAEVRMTFDEVLSDTYTVTIIGPTGSVAGDTATADGGRTLVFTPTEPFSAGAYDVDADVQDLAGNGGEGGTDFVVSGTSASPSPDASTSASPSPDASTSASPSPSTSSSMSPTPTPTPTSGGDTGGGGTGGGGDTGGTSPSPSVSASPSPSVTPSPSASPSPSVAPRDGAGYVALSSPTRVLDSRNGTGTAQGLKRGRVVLDLSGRVPAGATAAVLNVTVTNPTATGFVVAYPDGNAKPGTSNVNVVQGQTQANEVVVGLPASRRVVLFVDSTSAHVIADLVGFFTETERPDLGRVVTQAPVRVLDSREGIGTTVGRKRGEVVLDLTGKVPAGTTSVALNVTVAGPDARGFVVAFPTGTVRPGTSNVNFERGQTQANEVVVRLGTGANAGKVSLYVDSASAALIADLVASVVPRDGAGNQLFTALAQPERVMDTRTGLGGTTGRQNGSISLALPAGVVPAGATGVVLNVTSTGASRTGFVSVYPAGTANPGTSNVNFRPGVNQANEVLTAISGGRGVTLFVGGGGTPLTHVVVDVVGYLTSTG